MRKFSRKLDNRGASLVFTLLTVVVVLVLAALILSLSLSNFQSKAVDNMSRENFYSVEQAANEMYAGIGSYSIDILGTAYSTALSSVAMEELDGTITHVTTDKLNIFFREEYMINVIQYMTGESFARDSFFPKDGTGSPTYTTGSYGTVTYDAAAHPAMHARALTVLQQCLSNSAGVTVSLDGDITFDYDKFILILGDVHVEYENNGLLSKETFDMEIGFPDWSLTFLAASGRLGDDFTNFALVGDQGLDFNTDADVTGGMFGGGTAKTKSGVDSATNGIRINHVTVSATANSDGTGAVVSGGDIILKSSLTTESKFTLGANTKMWCSNFVIASNNHATEDKAAIVDLSSGSKTYVKDDMEIYGDNADITIAGKYMGYSVASYNGTNGNRDNGAPKDSSAIIVNGKKAKINIVTGAEVSLAGNAYINQKPEEDVSYMTGESIALKTNQQAYMVPSTWMNTYTVGSNTIQLNNPVSTTHHTNAVAAGLSDDVDFVNLTSIPAELKNLLVSGKEVAKKYDHSKYYFYFNFKSTADAAAFIQNYSTYLGTAAPDLSANLSDAQTEVVVNGTLTTLGAVAKANGTSVSFNAASTVDSAYMATANLNKTNYGNRYDLMRQLLVEVDESEIVYDKTRPSGHNFSGYFGENTIPTANYVIESQLVDQSGTNEEITVTVEGTPVSVTVIYTTNDIELSGLDSAKTYLVVALGNVEVKSSFTGLVMSEKKITVNSGSTFTAAPETIRKFLEANPTSSAGKEVNKVFETYRAEEDADEEDIEQLQYSDVLELTNWRKY